MSDDELVSNATPYFALLRDFWFRDLEVAVTGGANYLAALGLISYTEFMGGLILGTLGESRGVAERIRATWSRMGRDYLRLAAPASAYPDRIRNGLTHTYFMKTESAVAMHGDANTPGILERDGRLIFVVTSYLRDFRSMFDAYTRDVLELRDSSLLAALRLAPQETWHWRAAPDW